MATLGEDQARLGPAGGPGRAAYGAGGALPDPEATARTRTRYDRLARMYDWLEAGAEVRLRPWRRRLWARARGPRILEVGVGTGKNMPFYPTSGGTIGLDLSPRMIKHARARAAGQAARVHLLGADVQALPFADGSFDTVVATFVFCSVPDPVLGLAEVRRVLRPGGQVLLLEHVLSRQPILRALMRVANPIVVRLMGANINRDTLENVRRAGLTQVVADALWGDIVWLIEAHV